MGKHALLIGCNYLATDAPLYGCVNDAFLIKDMLKEHYGFADQDCKLLADTDKSYLEPTAKNIREQLTSMVKEAVSGDILYLHFSGHGVQIPAEEDSDEEDCLDEALVTCDMNLLVDDDLKSIVQNLAHGVAFTFTADCCHSGGMLDHKQVQFMEGTQDGYVFGPILNLFRAGSWGGGGGATRPRSLPMDDYLKELGKKTGSTVDKGNIREVIGSHFGGDASVKVQKYLDSEKIRMRGIDEHPDAKTSCWTSLMGFFRGQKGIVEESPDSEGLDEHLGVLITGCQSDETSADVDPPRRSRKAKVQGAMTNCLVRVVNSHFKIHPGKPISNYDLVKTVRRILDETGFNQTPSLEGSNRNAAAAFVTLEPITE